MESLKSLKEDFVSNLTGSSIEDINLVAISLLEGLFVRGLIVSIYDCLQENEFSFLNFSVDFLCTFTPIILSLTLYSNHLRLLVTLQMLPIFFLGIQLFRSKNKATGNQQHVLKKDKNLIPMSGRLPFLDLYRGQFLLSTCVAILAVDFKAFDRKYAKVETWGTSLMDLGVGSFVLMMGLVSYNATNSKRTKSTIFRFILPMTLFGILRLLFVKKMDYQEHITEYGVHWNFFFTLAVLPIIPEFFGINLAWPFVWSSIIMLFHEFVILRRYTTWILTSPRTNIISQNKEGIGSILGYLAIYVNGLEVGKFLGLKTRIANSTGQWKYASKLCLISAGYGILYSILDSGLPQTSRKLANMKYQIWILSNNYAIMCALALFDYLFHGKLHIKCRIWNLCSAINRNGLFVFLLANLFTGIINLCFNTLTADLKTSLMIITLYGLALSMIAALLDQLDITITMKKRS